MSRSTPLVFPLVAFFLTAALGEDPARAIPPELALVCVEGEVICDLEGSADPVMVHGYGSDFTAAEDDYIANAIAECGGWPDHMDDPYDCSSMERKDLDRPSADYRDASPTNRGYLVQARVTVGEIRIAIRFYTNDDREEHLERVFRARYQLPMPSDYTVRPVDRLKASSASAGDSPRQELCPPPCAVPGCSQPAPIPCAPVMRCPTHCRQPCPAPQPRRGWFRRR